MNTYISRFAMYQCETYLKVHGRERFLDVLIFQFRYVFVLRDVCVIFCKNKCIVFNYCHVTLLCFRNFSE